MILETIPGRKAVQNLRKNKAATWGNRLQDNRIEPIAAPVFDVPFQLEPKEPIFTIGSCFARNVERELLNRGFEVPMRKLLNTPEFKSLDPGHINNFGTPSIFNEIAWAFGDMSFDEETAFLEIANNRYVDLHMIPSVRPASLDVLRARRTGLFKATRTLAECGVMIMTLGLAEIWWDEEAQLYLNSAPPRSILRKSPDRFSLHVLDLDTCIDYLSRAFDLIFRHADSEMQVIITVSPVPMSATHRDTDVMTANTYSKSLLRVAAEYIAHSYDQVTYFPSYETVTISDRELAWMDDLVHVRPEMVKYNVDRMINAFSPPSVGAPSQQKPDLITPLDGVEASFRAAEARRARLADDHGYFTGWSRRTPQTAEIAWEYAQYFYAKNKYRRVLRYLDGNDEPRAQLLKAQCLFALKNYRQASETAADLCASSPKAVANWRIWLDALTMAKASLAELEQVERQWLDTALGARQIVVMFCGIAMRHAGYLEAALDRLRTASEDHLLPVRATLEYAECLVQLSQKEEALTVLNSFSSEDPSEMTVVQEKIAKVSKR